MKGRNLYFWTASALIILVCGSASAQTSPATGRIEQRAIFDSSYHRLRTIWVYTPPGYDAAAVKPYPLIVAFDGADYRDTIPLPRILDSLLAVRATPAFVAVLIDDSTSSVRIADLGNSRRMITFLGDQLMPWVRRQWKVTTDPARVIVTGSSAGGLGAAYVALERPDLFGNVLSQSGAFWRGAEASNDPPWEWLTGRVRTLERRPVRFLLDVGALETHPTLRGRGPVFIEAVRRFRAALEEKGYDVRYSEVPGGSHSPETWTKRLPPDIVTMSAGW